MQAYVVVPKQGADVADEWIGLGVEAHMQGKGADAERHYKKALVMEPRSAVATQNLAIIYAQSGNLNEALLTIERALLFNDKLGVAWMNQGLMQLDSERVGDALASCRKAIAIEENVHTRLALAVVLATAGLPAEAVPLYNKVLDEIPAHPQAGPNACFIQTLTKAGPAELLAQRRRWYDANAFKCEIKPHQNDMRYGRPLRVGYVGGDFKCHSAAMIFASVVLHHDPAKIQPYLYATLPLDPVADGATKKFKDMAGDRWRDIAEMDDEKADALIREDQIDIMVDLAGHTNGGRLSLFTRKPAPVQVTAWGFAHGTDCPEIDYFFADPVAVPEHERAHYAEKIYDLPCIVSYEPPEYGLKGVSDTPFRRNGYVTFGSSARYEKLSDECLAAFAEILRRVPDSRLRLKDHSYRRPYSIQRVMESMPDIAPERLAFIGSTPHHEHMQEYQSSDLILDPFPHTGGVVCMEQIYMGVPIVTLYGTQAAGRTTASVLTAMGRKEWIARTPQEYVETAVRLAENPIELGKARKTLRDEFLASRAIKGYREATEAAYRRIWAKHIGADMQEAAE